MRTVYISGPMAGYPNMNEPAFRAAEQTIWAAGAEPLTPHDIMPHAHPGICNPVYGDRRPGDHDSGCYLRGDIADMLDKATSLYVLPGWSRSRGAQIEVLIARLLRIPIEYHPDAERDGSAVEAMVFAATRQWRAVEPTEVVDLVAALRASAEAAKRRREARESDS